MNIEQLIDKYGMHRDNTGYVSYIMDDCESIELFPINTFVYYTRHQCEDYVEVHVFTVDQIEEYMCQLINGCPDD